MLEFVCLFLVSHVTVLKHRTWKEMGDCNYKRYGMFVKVMQGKWVYGKLTWLVEKFCVCCEPKHIANKISHIYKKHPIAINDVFLFLYYYIIIRIFKMILTQKCWAYMTNYIYKFHPKNFLCKAQFHQNTVMATGNGIEIWWQWQPTPLLLCLADAIYLHRTAIKCWSHTDYPDINMSVLK